MSGERLAAADEIVAFWIDEVGEEGWYRSDPALDAEITRRFGDLWHAARHDRADAWLVTARGALGHLILLDQFPRNMFRAEPRAFATDGLARARAKVAIGSGQDLATPEPARQFFYLPLMHSECLADQELCIALIGGRMPEAGSGNLPHAIKHRDVIRRFGRFPSRNAALGRADTDAERAYRAAGGYMS